MRSSSLLTAALLLASPFASASSKGHSHRRRDAHHRHIKRSETKSKVEARDLDVSYANGTSSHDLAKRQSYTGRGTFYYTGLGACGIYNSDSDFIVALNTPQYNEYGGGYPGPQCWKWITVQANGVTVSGIQITDECPSCDWGSLDMSPGLFQQFAPESVGVLAITWWFDGSGGQQQQSTSSTQQWTPTTSSTWQAPSTTTSSSQWTPSTTSTWSQPTTTSAWWSATTTSSAPPSSNTTTWSSTASVNTTTTNSFVVAASYNSTTAAATSTTTAANSSVTDAAGNTVPVPVAAAPASNNNLEAINGLVTNYGQIVVAAAGGKSS